jgi:Leucine-rich repeat (LRR) protein
MWRSVLQYRIRHLFVATAVIAGLLLPAVTVERCVRRENATALMITEYGGFVHREEVWPKWVPRRWRMAVVKVEIGETAARKHHSLADQFSQSATMNSFAHSTTPQELLSAVGDFACLREVDLHGAPISGADLFRIYRPSQIQKLDLSLTRAGNNPSALRRFHGLRCLSLNYTDIADDGLSVIENLERLQTLNLVGTGITDRGLNHLAKCRQLADLDISNTKVTDEGLVCLSDLRQLRSLNASNTEIVGRKLNYLSKLGNLSTLKLERSPGAGSSGRFKESPQQAFERALFDRPASLLSRELVLDSLQSLTALRSIFLANTILTEKGMASLSRQTSLLNLDLSGTNIEDDWLPGIGAMKLESLSVSDTPITGHGLTHIARMTTLKELRCERVDIVPKDLLALRELPNLELLILDQIAEGKDLAPILGQLRNLKSLCITNSGLVNSDVVALKALPHLENLNVMGNPAGEPAIINLRPQATTNGEVMVNF